MATLRLLARVATRPAAVVLRRTLRGPRRPTWDLRTELVHAILRGTIREMVRSGPRWARDFQRRMAQPVNVPGVVVDRRAEQLGGLHLYHVEHEGPTVLYCHGGGYVIGAPESYRNVVAKLLKQGGRAVIPAYRFAPEHPFPAGLDDIEAAYDLLRESTPANKIIIAGDSAGGGFCLGLLHRLKKRKADMPAGAFLISPWVNPFAMGGSVESNEGSDVLADDFGRWCARQVFGGMPETHPEAVPLSSDPTGYPTMLIQDGGAEMLADQITDFVKLARDSGIYVEHDREPDMFHVYQLMTGLIPEANRAMRDARRWMWETVDAASSAEVAKIAELRVVAD